MEQIVLNYIIKNNLINKGDRVAVAFSGGADSVALLHILNKIKTQLHFDLVCFHINHNIRGDEALRDEQFCINFAQNLGVSIYTESKDAVLYAKQHKQTLEQGARELRYNLLNSLATKHNINKICLAHHKNDQAETILMHLARGSNFNGLIGMKPITGNLVRPMLNVSKQQILEYINKNNLQYVTDSSNFCNDYSRNFIRNVILDKHNLTDSLLKLSECANELENKIESILPLDKIKIKNNTAEIDLTIFDLSNVVASRMIIKAIKQVGCLVDIQEKHITSIINLAKKQVGKYINLPNNLVALKQYSCIIIKQNNKLTTNVLPVKLGKFSFNNQQYIITSTKPNNCKYLSLDADLLPEGAVIGGYNSGDQIQTFAGNNKLVKSYLTNKKISANVRDQLPFIKKDNIVYAIFDVDISASVKITPNTKTIWYLVKS